MASDRSEVAWLRQVAYHEAGHAVAALLVHRRVLEVVAVPAADADGCVRMRNWMEFNPEWEITPTTVSRAKRAIFVTVAGPVAQKHLLHHGRARGCGHDDEAALHLAQRLCGADALALLTWLRVRAKTYLALNWVVVRGVAQALMVESSLTGRRLRSIATHGCGLNEPEWL